MRWKKNGEIFCADSSEISGEWEKSNTHIGRTSLDILGQNREMQNLPISRALKETATTKLARIMLIG